SHPLAGEVTNRLRSHQRKAEMTPALDPSLHVESALVPHPLHHVGDERGSIAGRAVDVDRHRTLGDVFVKMLFDEPAREEHRVRENTARGLVALADVEDHDLCVAVHEAVELLAGHLGDARERILDEVLVSPGPAHAATIDRLRAIGLVLNRAYLGYSWSA